MKGKHINYKQNQLHYIDLDSKFVILRKKEELLIIYSTKSGKSNLHGLGLSDLCMGVEKKIFYRNNAFLLCDFYGHALAQEPLLQGS